MNAETFSKIASGIQSIAVVCGLVTAGIWSYFVFIFQNPILYEQGFEAAGWEPKYLKQEIYIEKLASDTRLYEITLSISNTSKTLVQRIRPQSIVVFYAKLGDKQPLKADFESFFKKIDIDVDVGETRTVRFAAVFPSDGVYKIEANVCENSRESYSGCVVQKYVGVHP